MSTHALPPAALAFDAIAETFDARFAPWRSVAAQRKAVRTELAHAFPRGAKLIEIGGGTGDDALWLAARGRRVLMTDASPAMIRVARAKFAGRANLDAAVAPAETLAKLADARDPARFDGAYSNFAVLNCVSDLRPFARGLARLLRPGAPALLILFGCHSPGEMIVEAMRGRPANMWRRLSRQPVPARLGGQCFTVHYHRRAEIGQALAPWFEPAGRAGIGIFVPPSAAEPWISRHPHLLDALQSLDRRLAAPLASLGDHILYRFVRNDAEAPAT